MKNGHPYRAYLLRCWREESAVGGRECRWRCVVEEVFGERRRWGFASPEALADFLRDHLGGDEEPSGDLLDTAISHSLEA